MSALSHLAPLWPPSEDDKNSSITSQQLHKAHLEYSTKWMWRERSEEILAHAGDYASGEPSSSPGKRICVEQAGEGRGFGGEEEKALISQKGLACSSKAISTKSKAVMF